jgi:SAM-dependent methyltransferase
VTRWGGTPPWTPIATLHRVEPWREAVWHAVPEGAEPERFAERRAFLLEHARRHDRVLDLGCGDGTFAYELVVAGCEVAAVDVAQEAVRRARERVPRADIRHVEEGERLPFDEDAFDVVWAGEVLEHVVDVVGLLAEVRRVLRWGGRLLVTTPYHGRVAMAALALRGLDAHFDPRADHLRFFTARTLRAVLDDAGFRGIQIEATGGVPLLRRALHATAR